MILDWLLQETPQDLLSKLEVYTFGNAANHFNNPHRHVHSQNAALNNPIAASTDATNLASPAVVPVLRAPSPNNLPQDGTDPVETTASAYSLLPSLTSETSSLSPSTVSGRAIGHIEHYAHTTDFVALWGVLHFATSALSSHSMPRFIGRVFARTSSRGGHQMVQHYLDSMFPLEKHADPAKGFVGCLEEGNEFMESEIVIGAEGEEMAAVREAMGASWLARGDRDSAGGVEIHGGSPVETRGRFRSRVGEVGENGRRETKVKVKELSRLWLYRNGKSPADKPPFLMRDGDGFVRTATL